MDEGPAAPDDSHQLEEDYVMGGTGTFHDEDIEIASRIANGVSSI
jgi:hypothetical protein